MEADSTDTNITITREQALQMAADTAIIRMDMAQKILSDMVPKIEAYLRIYPDDKELRSFRGRIADLIKK